MTMIDNARDHLWSSESTQEDDPTSTVDKLIDGRVSVYGDPVLGFTRIAQVWSGILGVEVQPVQVALCQIGMKAVRASETPNYSDNSDDIEGYLDIFRKIVGPDMIHARSVSDYLAQMRRRR